MPDLYKVRCKGSLKPVDLLVFDFGCNVMVTCFFSCKKKVSFDFTDFLEVLGRGCKGEGPVCYIVLYHCVTLVLNW